MSSNRNPVTEARAHVHYGRADSYSVRSRTLCSDRKKPPPDTRLRTHTDTHSVKWFNDVCSYSLASPQKMSTYR